MNYKAQQKIYSFSYVDPNRGCWDWIGCVQSNGYGRVRFDGKSMGAHRLSFIAFHGGIPEKMDVCHKCDNRKCVNPNHLFIGTRKQNMEDAVFKNRQAKGFMLPSSKLSDEDKREIISLAKSGVKYKDIAEKFSICQQRAGQIALTNGVRRNGKR